MEERDLDFYANTSDEYFNRNALRLYAYFTSYNKPKTKKPFEDFIDAIYEAYFFAINNPSKPIGCKEIVKELAKEKGFKNADLLLFEDLLLIIESNSPGLKLNKTKYPQLIDVIQELTPFDEEPKEMIDTRDIYAVYYFDIDSIKKELKKWTKPSNKLTYLSKLVFDFYSHRFGIKERELNNYESKKLIPFLKTESDRLMFEVEVQNKNKPVNKIKLDRKKKADFIRMISDMVDNDIFEPVNPAVFLTKEYVLDAFGKWLNEDLQIPKETEKPLKLTLMENTSKKSEEQGKAFPDYLLHENKKRLADAIKEEFSTEKGKAIRIILEAMEAYDPPLISISSRQAKELYKSLSLFMNRDIGTYQGVFGYPFDKETDKADIDSVTIRLNHLLRIVEKDKTA